MDIRENESLKAKTTMRIGGIARYFAQPLTREDVEEAWQFAEEHRIPLIVLGGGSNTVFASGVVNALVIRPKADRVSIDENAVTVQAGKILAMLINELAERGLDLSPLTGILGNVGGAIFGNAGQGATGIWIDSFVENVTAFVDGRWQTFTKEECHFRYRESWFKDQTQLPTPHALPPIIWETTLNIPHKAPAAIRAEVEKLLKRRIETQPHLKTAGSCFKSLPDGTPAWKLIDAAGLRGTQIGGIQVSEKHANFLLNMKEGTFDDIVAVTTKIKESVPQIADIEMRLYGGNGEIIHP